MPLIRFIIVLAIFGGGFWAVNKFSPKAGPTKIILNVVVAILACLWLFRVFVTMGGIQIGR